MFSLDSDEISKENQRPTARSPRYPYGCAARRLRKLASNRVSEAREVVRQRVVAAHIRDYCELDDTNKVLMRSVMNQLDLSARTIADLAGADQIQAAHLAEASTSHGGKAKHYAQVCYIHPPNHRHLLGFSPQARC